MFRKKTSRLASTSASLATSPFAPAVPPSAAPVASASDSAGCRSCSCATAAGRPCSRSIAISGRNCATPSSSQTSGELNQAWLARCTIAKLPAASCALSTSRARCPNGCPACASSTGSRSRDGPSHSITSGSASFAAASTRAASSAIAPSTATGAPPGTPPRTNKLSGPKPSGATAHSATAIAGVADPSASPPRAVPAFTTEKLAGRPQKNPTAGRAGAARSPTPPLAPDPPELELLLDPLLPELEMPELELPPSAPVDGGGEPPAVSVPPLSTSSRSLTVAICCLRR